MKGFFEEGLEMPRICLLYTSDAADDLPRVSLAALDGFVLGDIEKEYLLNLIKRLSSFYFTEVLCCCLMGNHFHILVRMQPG